jgi:uncharacterized protein with FMN-binding domain
VIAFLIAAVLVADVPVARPSASPSATTAQAVPQARKLPAVIVNGVLFEAVEFDTAKAAWRNLAVTIKAEQLAAWKALPVQTKNGYAQQLIDNYRTGLNFAGNLKLTFVDEQRATLDQYIWTPPPAPERARR